VDCDFVFCPQLVNIGSQYSYSSEDQSEFLVVVSRDFNETPRKVSKPTNKERVGCYKWLAYYYRDKNGKGSSKGSASLTDYASCR
jgi:hypothetical protein